MRMEQTPEARFARAERPAHVPSSLAFDFDIYALDGFEPDVHGAWKRVQDEKPPVFWTPHYGGHWVVTRGEQIREIQENYADFSHREMFIPRGVIPFSIPVQLDPPQHGPYRRIFAPAFLPRALVDVEAKARRVAIEIIEDLAPRGECEFVADFAGAMPIIAFLTMLDLPQEDYAYLRRLAVYMSKPTHPKSPEAWAEISAYVRRLIEARKASPGEDLVSRILTATIDDRPLSEGEVFSMCLLLLGGGLDTVVSMTTFIARFLAENPDHRRQLRVQPQLIDRAIEELARRFGTTNTARLVTRDRVFAGVELKKDEMIVAPNPLFGLDETINPAPMAVDFERERSQHAAFGSGPHTCPGAVLARREIRIFLQEWLPRIPDFRIKPGTRPRFTTGVVNSAAELWLTWDPAAGRA